jgi:hypothetical protein
MNSTTLHQRLDDHIAATSPREIVKVPDSKERNSWFASSQNRLKHIDIANWIREWFNMNACDPIA